MQLPYHLTSRTIERFLREYSIKCISHTALMPGEKRQCACSKPITSKFYLFSYEKDKEEKSFSAGPTCGKRLIEQAGIECPPLFDPFKSASNTQSSGCDSSAVTGVKTTLSFSPLNNEIYNLLNLYRCMTCKELSGPLLTVFSYIINNPTGTVFDSYFSIIDKAVNSAVRNTDFETLQDYFENLAKSQNKKFKRFSFPFFKEKLAAVREN